MVKLPLGSLSLATLIAACSASTPQQGVSVTAPADPERSDIVSVVEADESGQEILEDLIGSDLFGRLSGLQVAVDAFVEEKVQLCMAEEGYDYVQRSRQALASRRDPGGVAYFTTASQLDRSLAGEGLESSNNPNASIYSSLSPDERVGWDQQHADCRVAISAEHYNPLLDESDWFAQIGNDAAERAASSPEVIEAGSDARTCFREDSGYEDVATASGVIDSQVLELNSKFKGGLVDAEEVRELLEPLVVEEEQLSQIYAKCQSPLLQVQGEVFSEYLLAAAEADADSAALWAVEFSDQIAPYEDYYYLGGD